MDPPEIQLNKIPSRSIGRPPILANKTENSGDVRPHQSGVSIRKPRMLDDQPGAHIILLK
jgi:hypothetical protein